MIRQFKDKKMKECTIKIYVWKPYFLEDKTYSFGEPIRWCCDIDDGLVIHSFCRHTKKELFDEILENFNLKKKTFKQKIKRFFSRNGF
jgi:hypothetical protein